MQQPLSPIKPRLPVHPACSLLHSFQELNSIRNCLQQHEGQTLVDRHDSLRSLTGHSKTHELPAIYHTAHKPSAYSFIIAGPADTTAMYYCKPTSVTTDTTTAGKTSTLRGTRIIIVFVPCT